MKCLTALATLAASPALAHPGVHGHPHGVELWMAVGASLVVIAVACGIAYTRSRK